MKYTQHLMITVLLCWISASEIHAQTNQEQIVALRNASNQALKSHDLTKILSYLTDDVLITTGNGTLLTNKNALKHYILDAGASKMFWIRTPNEIVVNEKRGLAWENGTWKGYDPDKDKDAIVGGNYSAMWTKASGAWKIKSQLFVTLEEK